MCRRCSAKGISTTTKTVYIDVIKKTEKYLFSMCCTESQIFHLTFQSADLVIFTEEILNVKLHFLRSIDLCFIIQTLLNNIKQYLGNFLKKSSYYLNIFHISIIISFYFLSQILLST